MELYATNFLFSDIVFSQEQIIPSVNTQERTPVDDLYNRVAEFMSSWSEKSLKLPNLSDRDLLSSEILNLSRTIYQTIFSLSIQGTPHSEIFQKVIISLEQAERKLSRVVSRFKVDKAVFMEVSEEFDRTCSAERDFSPFVAAPKLCKKRPLAGSVSKHEASSIESAKTLIGVGVDAVFLPFAALSKTIKLTIKGLYLAGVSNGCLENDPLNFNQCVAQLRNTFEGHDPEVNKVVKEAMPRWVRKGFELLAEGDAQLEKFDEYMVSEFHTIPGLIHEGCEGIVDVALAGASGAAIKVIRGAGKGAASTINAVGKVSTKMPVNIQNFIADECGGVKFPFDSDLPSFLPRKLGKDRLIEEMKLLGYIKETAPALKPPIKRTSQLLLSDYYKHTFTKPDFNGTLLLKTFDDSVLYIFRDTWGSNQLFAKTKGINKKVKYILEEVFTYAQENRLSRVLLAWNPEEYSVATFLENHDVFINSIGSLPTIESKALVIVETPVSSLRSILKKGF